MSIASHPTDRECGRSLPLKICLFASCSIQTPWSFLVEVELDKLVPSDQDLKIGISAVIKTINNGVTFWALTHPGPQADFHLRDSFIVDL